MGARDHTDPTASLSRDPGGDCARLRRTVPVGTRYRREGPEVGAWLRGSAAERGRCHRHLRSRPREDEQSARTWQSVRPNSLCPVKSRASGSVPRDASPVSWLGTAMRERHAGDAERRAALALERLEGRRGPGVWLRLRTPVPLGTFTNRMNFWRATRLGARAPRHRARARDPAPHADRRALRSPGYPK